MLIKKVSVFLLFPALLASSCFHNQFYPVSDSNRQSAIQRLNRLAGGKQGQIVTAAGDTLLGRDISISNDAVSWLGEGAKSRDALPVSSISKIVIRKRNAGKGFVQGFLTGAAIGGGLGLIGMLTSDVDCSGADNLCIEEETALVGGIIVFGVPFGLIGLASGATAETTVTYDFEAKVRE